MKSNALGIESKGALYTSGDKKSSLPDMVPEYNYYREFSCAISKGSVGRLADRCLMNIN